MIRDFPAWINQEWIDEINACQTIEEVRALWHHKWSPDDDFLNHTMGNFCWIRIDEIKKETENESNCNQ